MPWMQKSLGLNCSGGGVEQALPLCTGFPRVLTDEVCLLQPARGFSGKQLKVSVLRCSTKQCMGWENLGCTDCPMRGEESKEDRQVAGGRDSLLCHPADPCPTARWLLSFLPLRIIPVSLQKPLLPPLSQELPCSASSLLSLLFGSQHGDGKVPVFLVITLHTWS